MIEIDANGCDAVAGGAAYMELGDNIGRAWKFLKTYYEVMGYVGGTLNNYYGADMTLQIVAAGGMGA